jgi:hypothetical protein
LFFLLALGLFPLVQGFVFLCHPRYSLLAFIDAFSLLLVKQARRTYITIVSAPFYRELIDIGLYNPSFLFFLLLLSSPVSYPTFPSFVIDVLQDEGFFFRVFLSSGLCPGHWIGMPLDDGLRMSILMFTVLGF